MIADVIADWAAEWGEGRLALAGGALVGVLFGALAQRSRFCLRAATIDFWRGELTSRVAVWTLTFASAVLITQWLVRNGLMDLTAVRQLNARGSLSGAIIGGAMFGVGMVMTRGCASRLLVLSANGNLRALLSGLVFAVAAQATLRGALSPVRDRLADLWTLDGADALNALSLIGFGANAGLILGMVFLLIGLVFAIRVRLRVGVALAAAGVGAMVAAAWWFTGALAQASFDPQPVKSLSFTGPSANMLMLVLSPPGGRLDFDLGLVPGVVLGSFLAALFAGELKLEGFDGGRSMRRYITGALLMGFGGMLAGGCAIGAGVSGASLFATISWATLFAMWAAAGLADAWLDRPADARPATAVFRLQPPETNR